MNEQEYQEYVRRVNAGEQVSDADHYRAQMFLTSGIGTQSQPFNPVTQSPYGRQFNWQNTGKDIFGNPLPDPYLPEQDPNQFRPQGLDWLSGNITATETMERIDPITGEVREETFDVRSPGIFNPSESKQDKKKNTWDLDPNALPFLYPGGSDISTQLYTAGRALGMEKGTQGRGLTLAGSLGAATMGISRNLLAGIGYEKRNNYVRDWYRNRQNNPQYTKVSASNAVNTTGGMYGKYGGIFEDGGFMPQQEQSGMPQQEQTPQPQDQMQQVFQAVAEALQQGAQPQQVVEMLVQEGLPQEEAVAVVEEVMSALQGQQQQQMAPEQVQPEMKLGGKKVGDPITFKYGGKKISGKIKKIENGKIFI